jgi:hypothetical protein
MKAIFERVVHLVSWLALCSVALVDFLLHPLAPDADYHSPVFRAAAMLVLTPLTILVGFLIMRRVPGNIVGPLLIAWSGTVAYWSLREGISPVLFTLFYYYDMVFGWLALFLMVLHFPNGKIYPPGAAPWIHRLLIFFFLFTNCIFLSTDNFLIPSRMANPFYVPALGTQADLILTTGLMFLIPFLVLVLVSPILRFRMGNHLERQQIKWLALFAVLLIPYAILGLIVYPLLTGGEAMNPGSTLFGVFFFTFTGLFPPIAIGIAVLRHRLWDIDIIIRRTLVYSILTVVLSLIYFGSVVLLQSLSQIIIGHPSPVMTVVSTLAVVMLFTPLRRRIQERIDRRFYRQRYDAEQVLADFGITLRNEAYLDRLTHSILAVIEETMHPAQVSLWLRKTDSLPVDRR